MFKHYYIKAVAVPIFIAFCLLIQPIPVKAQKMPYYTLSPKAIVLRSSFYTTYTNSTPERKHNICLSANSINGSFIDVDGEFSFNKTVGARTIERGFKSAKIIVDGEFVEGVGGGVCQVSSTLYNAVILSGLKITEYHPHSLPVSYVAPSFDAMVSYNFADLKFVNNTNNPIIIKAIADENVIKIEIYGQPLNVKYIRESVLLSQIPPPKEKLVIDYDGEYPDLYEDEYIFLRYSKGGYVSEGYLITQKNGVEIARRRIRKDSYSATCGLVIKGCKKREKIPAIFPEFPFIKNLL